MAAGMVAAGWPSDPTPLVPALVATCLCLSAAVATLMLTEVVAGAVPEFGPHAVLAGTGVRMGVAVVGVVLLGEVVGRLGTPREYFANWVAYLYVVTLVAECGLLVRGRRNRIGSEAPP